METKECKMCHQLKQQDEFGIDKSTIDGLSRYCKSCKSKMRKKSYYRLKNDKPYVGKFQTQQQLNDGRYHNPMTYKKVLIRTRGNKCQCCGLQKWMDKPINLQLHHIDGNHYNNNTKNLKLLCPNCHSYTDNYCGKNKKQKQISIDQFAYAIKQTNSINKACQLMHIAKTGTNYAKAYSIIDNFQENSYGY